ncbi:NUDIX hydrolase domain-like protein [Phellopilus nigrolimitatus]|nr:NUDIX hydrolase domain-like protein [Phellopilus nigrolimitatus]
MSKLSFLSLVESCDNFRLTAHRDALTPFCLSADSHSVVGLLWPEVVDALRTDNKQAKSKGKKPTNSEKDRPKVKLVHFAAHLFTPSLRSAALASTCKGWHDSGVFASVIGGRMWRDELYPIYRDPFGAQTPQNVAFEVERAACALFGFVTYGVHMTIYQPAPPGSNEEAKVWVPTRSKTKQTWPGYLDNSVAGGIPAGLSPFESLVKESMEEASIPEKIVRKHARACGALSYFFQKEKRWLQPEVEYVYVLETPPLATPEQLEAFRPKPLDGEVEFFELLPLSEVVARLHEGKFKTNCAVVLIDFLIQRGLITPESEPNFLEITTRLHSRFGYELWGSLSGAEPSMY